MSESAVRIAVSIKDRAVRQLVCNMFGAAGASTQVCADAAAIADVVDSIQAIVLGLGAAPEETLDALVMLRQRSATIPIYVIADAAGERHGKRATKFGATQVVPQELLERRVGHLVQQVKQSGGGGGGDLKSRPPGWAADKVDSAYQIESMDMGAWLSIPGNRRLLGMEEPYAAAALPADAPRPRDDRSGADRRIPVPPRPAVPAGEERRVRAAPAQLDERPGGDRPIAAPPPRQDAPAGEVGAAPDGGADSAPCGLADCGLLVHCRAQHDAQNAAILEAHKQRDQRLHEINQRFRERLLTDIRSEVAQVVAQQGGAGEAAVQARIDACEAALRRVNLMMGGLFVVVAALAGLGLAWRFGVL